MYTVRNVIGKDKACQFATVNIYLFVQYKSIEIDFTSESSGL